MPLRLSALTLCAAVAQSAAAKPLLGLQDCPKNASNVPPYTLPPTACARPNMDRSDICAHNQRPPPLTNELVAGARVYANRHEALESQVPRGGRIVEVGTMNGHLSRWLASHLHPTELVIMDISPDAIRKCETFHSKGIQSGKVRCVLGDSVRGLKALPDNHFDMIYVDADHAYGAVCADMEAAKPKLKPGGLMVMNDYYSFESQFLANPFAGAKEPRFGVYGIIHATNEFMLRYGWKMAYLAMHPMNFPDVAIVKPHV